MGCLASRLGLLSGTMVDVWICVIAIACSSTRAQVKKVSHKALAGSRPAQAGCRQDVPPKEGDTAWASRPG